MSSPTQLCRLGILFLIKWACDPFRWRLFFDDKIGDAFRWQSCSHIPSLQVFMLTGLTKLRLSDNEISVIPPEIASLENLRHLILDRNKVAPHLSPLFDLHACTIKSGGIEVRAVFDLRRSKDYCSRQIRDLPDELGRLDQVFVR